MGDPFEAAEKGMNEEHLWAVHTIPVPRGWSIEQAWEAISRGDTLKDEEPDWANVLVRDGMLVRVLSMHTVEGR